MSRWITPFLDSLRQHSVVARACRDAGISSSTAYALRRSDADFAAAWDNAIEDATDALVDEARRRALYGVEEPVIHKGTLTPVWEYDADGQPVRHWVQVGVYPPGHAQAGEPAMELQHKQARNPDGSLRWLTVRKPSDPLLMFLLKGDRAKYGTDRTEVTGRDGAPLQVADATARAGRIAALLGLASGRKANNVDDLL
jgi:hypothetical protein